MTQENLYAFYSELVDEGKWQTKNYQISLSKKMLMIESRDKKIRMVLDLRTPQTNQVAELVGGEFKFKEEK